MPGVGRRRPGLGHVATSSRSGSRCAGLPPRTRRAAGAAGRDGISARRGIMAAHRQPAYAGRDTGAATCPVTERLTDHTLILPLFHQLTEDEQSRVIQSILKAAGHLMTELLLIGASGLAREVLACVRENGQFDVVGVLDDDESRVGQPSTAPRSLAPPATPCVTRRRAWSPASVRGKAVNGLSPDSPAWVFRATASRRWSNLRCGSRPAATSVPAASCWAMSP